MGERASLSMNGIWRMAPDPRGDGASRGCMRPDCDDGRWRAAPVPSVFEHDCPELDFYRGQCWYRRRVALPAEWQGRRVVLHFGGMNYRASVWLNGVKLGDSPDGFLPIAFPLGDAAVYGAENLLAVCVDNRHYPGGVPGMHVGWRMYGGILRDVTLVATDRLYLDDLYVIAEPDGRVTCRLRIVNARQEEVRTAPAVTIAGADGTLLALSGTAITLAPGEAADVSLEGTIQGVIPWSPETPHLYTATASLGEGESMTVRFGARHIEAKPDGLWLNGRPIFLAGFNRHEDSPRTAMAVDPALTRQDLEGMLAAGANCVRLCHYPHDPHTLDLCDELGLIVFAEVPLYFWNDADEGRRTNAMRVETAARQLERMIRRDRNHPSVCFWSVSNETNEDVPEVAEGNRTLIRLARALDPTRLCIHVSNHWQDAPNFAEDDLICVNGYPSMDWAACGCSDVFRAGRSGDEWREGLATLRAQYSDKPILVTEFGFSSMIGTDGHDFDEATHARVLEMEYAGFDAPYLCGALIWCWADHAWDVQRFHGGLIISPFGVVSRDRRPKQALDMATQLFTARLANKA